MIPISQSKTNLNTEGFSMVINKKWHVLLCALVLIAAVVLATFVVTSCSCGNDEPVITGSDGTSGTETPDTDPLP